MTDSPYQFVKVDDFFSDFQKWETLPAPSGMVYDPASRSVTVSFTRENGQTCAVLLSIIQRDTVRVRFNPALSSAADYSPQNTRSIVMDTMAELADSLQADEPFEVSAQEIESGQGYRLVTSLTGSGTPTGGTPAGRTPVMQVVVTGEPFQISIYGYEADGSLYRRWQSAAAGLSFTATGDADYSIVQGIEKPPTAVYTGFGEHGGRGLLKADDQLNFFDYDNFTDTQVYGQGPFQEREPLYHSNPFFLELNGTPGRTDVCGVFVDNPSQVLVDVGYSDSGQCLIGTRFGDLDYFVMCGDDPAGAIGRFTSLVGLARLKPRFALGYHQGCYGYEDAGALTWVVGRYRANQIPFDGLHIDVDFQNDYQTFTVNNTAFPDVASMFAQLRGQGVKCSTNITPVIANTPGYAVHDSGIQQNVFVPDERVSDGGSSDCPAYQQYGNGAPYSVDEANPQTPGPFLGRVSYGTDLSATGNYPDLGVRGVRDWWGQQYQVLFDDGLEMVWQDMTTPAVDQAYGDMKSFPFRLLVTSDWECDVPPVRTAAMRAWNLYSYNLHKATYHGLNNLTGRENKRNFIIGRGSLTGMHRFAALWTGDNASAWDFLQINIAQVLALGMSGQPLSGQDIGGFAPDPAEPGQGWVGPELLMRWTMLGSFMPWFRNHYNRKPGQKDFQEPFQYTEWFQTWGQQIPESAHDLYPMVTPVCRQYIELRYRLMQLFYDTLFENTITGMPICRPLFVTDPQDGELLTSRAGFLDNEFCVGSDLLVAPIVEPEAEGDGVRDVYLPAGANWYGFMDDVFPLAPAVPGGTTVRGWDASLSTQGQHLSFLVPMYVRAGAIIPTIGLEQYVGQLNAQGTANPVTLNIYPGASGSYSMYLDDGVSRSSAQARPTAQGGDPQARGEYRHTQIEHQYSAPGLRQITMNRIVDGYTPPLEKYFQVSVLHDPGEKLGQSGPLTQVELGNSVLLQVASLSDLDSSPTSAWCYDSSPNRSLIKVFDDDPAMLLQLTYQQ